jgi:hypothetical protein
LPGFTFGLDVVLLVGQLRQGQHQTVDEIHHTLLERLAPLHQSISRREVLFLFEAYTALLRSGTEVSHDQQWRDVARLNEGLLLSIDGIQPDKGNETIYLVRDLLTGRLLTAENVTSNTKETIKQVLAPVVALQLPILGVISDAQESQLQAIAELWPGTPHQICQFHALKEAGRLIYVLDHRIKTDMRIRMQQKTHEYRQDLSRRRQQAQGEEASQLAILDEYGLPGSDFFQIRINPAGQGDDPILDRDPDFVGPHARIPFQFFQDIGLDFFIRTDAHGHVASLLSMLELV